MQRGSRVKVTVVRGAVESDSIVRGGAPVEKTGTVTTLDEDFAFVRFDDGDVQALDPRGTRWGYPVLALEVLS